jgi:16S rRNA (uracil1498-N3)-methyltransferase
VVEVLRQETPRRELPLNVTVAAPLPKGDRAQFLVEKLTELGVTRFIPLHTRRSVVHPGEGKHEKLKRYVIEASKQCGRNVLMQVEPVTEWAVFCKGENLARHRVLAHISGDAAIWPRREDLALAVGPEGGFAEDEVELAKTCGWRIIALGPRTLRVETAAIVLAACAVQAGM